MDPGHFLRLIIDIDIYYYYNFKTRMNEANNELVRRAHELIKMSLEKGADPNTIDYLSYPLPAELSKLFIENKQHPLDPVRLLALSMNQHMYTRNRQAGKEQKELIEYLIKKIPGGKEKIVFTKILSPQQMAGSLDVIISACAQLDFDTAWGLLKKVDLPDENIIKVFLGKRRKFRAHSQFMYNIALSHLNENSTPICYAAIHGDIDLLKKLIHDGSDINTQDKQGNTPLILSILRGNHESTELLLEHKADVNIVNKANMNALHASQYRFDITGDESNFELMVNLISKYGINPGVIDNYGNNPINKIMDKFLPVMLYRMEHGNFIENNYKSSLNKILDDVSEQHADYRIKDILPVILKYTDNHIYDLVVKKLRGQSVQNFRKAEKDRQIYIGIASSRWYYSARPFYMATKMMSKYKDLQVKLITPDMINDEFIQQFDGLIIPGAGDNFPKNQGSFTLEDLNENTMISSEKLYQHVISLADKYSIPTVGMCSGNQHIILYHNGALKPVKNYAEMQQHQGIFIKNSIPYFLTLTPAEQRQALKSCSLPEISFDIATAHHYAGVKDQLGENLELGATSEEGVVQSVYKGTNFIGFQFHPENYYSSLFYNPNRSRLIWENFLEICCQHRRYYLYAQENNLNINDVLRLRDVQNEKIISKLEECSRKNSSIDTKAKDDFQNKSCRWLFQVAKENNLDFIKLMEVLLEDQEHEDDVAKINECIQQKNALELLYINTDESLPTNKDMCDHSKFQWSDYDKLYTEEVKFDNIASPYLSDVQQELYTMNFDMVINKK